MYLGIDYTWQNQVPGCINILGRVRINSRIDSLNSTVLACDVVLAGSAIPVGNQTIANYQVVIVQIRTTRVMEKRVNKFKAFCRYGYACFGFDIVPLALGILKGASICLETSKQFSADSHFEISGEAHSKALAFQGPIDSF